MKYFKLIEDLQAQNHKIISILHATYNEIEAFKEISVPVAETVWGQVGHFVHDVIEDNKAKENFYDYL